MSRQLSRHVSRSSWVRSWQIAQRYDPKTRDDHWRHTSTGLSVETAKAACEHGDLVINSSLSAAGAAVQAMFTDLTSELASQGCILIEAAILV